MGKVSAEGNRLYSSCNAGCAENKRPRRMLGPMLPKKH